MNEWTDEGRHIYRDGELVAVVVVSADHRPTELAREVSRAANDLRHAQVGAQAALRRETVMHEQMEKIRKELEDILQFETSQPDTDARLAALLDSWPEIPQPTLPAPRMVRVTVRFGLPSPMEAVDYSINVEPGNGLNYQIPNTALSVSVDPA